MDKNTALASVNEIKEMMEKSSKFTSISGFTAILAGVYALAGALAVKQIPAIRMSPERMIIVALSVLAASAVTGVILSYARSKKTRQKFFSRLTYRALWSFSLPMLAGGVLCASALWHGYGGVISSVMLLFYGLALVNFSRFTYSGIVWLGYAFVGLGMLDCFCDGHGLLFWTVGFGGFHILYGIVFYLHYERKA